MSHLASGIHVEIGGVGQHTAKERNINTMVGIQNVFDFLSGDFLAISFYDGVGKTVNLLVTQEEKVTRYSAASIFFSLLGLRLLKFDFGRFESIHNS